MLSDHEIAAMSATQRRDLIRRLSRHVDDLVPSRRLLNPIRDLRVVLMVASVAVLVPWICYLALSLPRSYVAHNWDTTWVGFDVLLLGLLVTTAVLGFHNRLLLVLTAFATGILLICDAWFDVMTSHGDDQTWSLVTAVVVELPLALVLMAGSLQVLRLVAARLWALEPGDHSWQVEIPLPSTADDAVRRAHPPSGPASHHRSRP